MDGNLIIVEVLINRVFFRPILIDIGCKYYFIMDKDLIIKLRFPCVKVPPKPIIGFIKENIKEPGVEINEIVKFFINIQDYRRNIFPYMVPVLLNLIIIGLL